MEKIEIKNETKFYFPENIVYREEDNGAFLFDANTNNLKAVNESGKDILDNIIDITFENLINKLLEMYEGVSKEQLETDVKNFLTELISFGFLKIKKEG